MRAMNAPTTAPGPIYDADTYEPRKAVGYLLHRIRASQVAALDREFAKDPALAALEVTAAQYFVLSALFDHDGDRLSRLCREMSYDPGAMSRMIDRLEAKGLITKGRSHEDRRRINVELTAAGATSVPRMRAHSAGVLNRVLAGFTQSEARQLEDFLHRMADNLC